MLNLDCITLLMMHSVRAKTQTLWKVKRTWLCPESWRSPRKDVPKFLQVCAASAVMILGIAAVHGRERDCSAVFVTCWRHCPRGYLDTTSLFCQTAEKSCALQSIIPSWSRTSRSENTHCFCLLSYSLCLYKLVVCYKSNLAVFSVVKFEVRLFSELFPLFQLLALAPE